MRMAMMAMTTNNSMRVKPEARVRETFMRTTPGWRDRTRSQRRPALVVEPADFLFGQRPGEQHELVDAAGEVANRAFLILAIADVPVAQFGVPDAQRGIEAGRLQGDRLAVDVMRDRFAVAVIDNREVSPLPEA